MLQGNGLRTPHATAMTTTSLLALCLFGFVASITPGPNNLMLLASGMNFGFRATLPHLAGVCIGFSLMTIAIGAGLGVIVTQVPLAYGAIRWLGAAYLLYLAWRIAMTPVDGATAGSRGPAKPLGFMGAAMFQWVNPKAWASTVSAFAIYVPVSPGAWTVLGVSVLVLLINLPCTCAWTLFGARLRHWLGEPGRARTFNWSMAALLVASLVPMLGTGPG
jgi:threonine/homoserine/homoserine lactone efflux protein